MILTKQQEKDIKELIELAKQSDDEYNTINIHPGIDFTYYFDKGELVDWDFVCTNKKDTAIKSVVDLLNTSNNDAVENFMSNFPAISQVEENHKNKHTRLSNLYNDILRRIPNLTEDLLEDTIWFTKDIEELKKILAEYEYKSKNDKISDLEKDLKQITDPKLKQRLTKILK